MDAAALRERTRAEHEATEALVPLMSEHLERSAYIEMLRRFYTVVRGWEAWAEEHAPKRFRALLSERRRSVLLERDLRFLGESRLPEPLPREVFERLPGTEEHFLGALYVVEGSTLGGQYIAKHVERVLELTPGEGDAYFCGYGERTGAMWREVKGLLQEAPAAWLDDTVLAARSTFGIFAEALGGGTAELTAHGASAGSQG